MIESAPLPKEKACKAFGVSKQSFYKWRNREPLLKSDGAILGSMQQIAVEFPKYGYRRMTKALHRQGEQINHKKVYRIMQENNLLVRRKKFRPVTTQSGHGLEVYPNLAKDLVVTKLNQLWVSDITYIYLPLGFGYLAAILDIFSRKCVGWCLGISIDAQLTLDALNMAVAARQHLGFIGMIHHSDRGVQYASQAYIDRLKEVGIGVSMSGKGNAYDNAFAESFMKTLKVEEVYINEYRTFEEAHANIKHFIELVYNAKRLHSSIGYVPPEEFEAEILNKQSLN
jgi:transposase InsO family protein